MGYNTPLLILNDGLDTLETDPQAGKKIASLVKEMSLYGRGEMVSAGIGNHCNVISALPPQHADGIQLIAVGGNRIQYLGYGGGYRATPEEMLKNLADQLGYRIVKKKVSK